MDNLPDSLEPSPVKENGSSKRDFWIGFIGWWIFNIIAGVLNFALTYVSITVFQDNSDLANLIGYLPTAFGCLVLLLNVGALIFFAFRRKQIALGMLVAFGVSIAISLLIGIIAAVACFVILSQYNNL
jgi:hypothetical protein